MSYGFGADQSFGGNGDLIENGFVCWANVMVRGLKTSQNTGSRYLDLELTISAGQKNASRKVWVNVMDFTYDKNSEGARTMGIAAIQHMLESNGVFKPSQPESYKAFDGKGIEEIALAIDQTQVAIRVKIEKGTDGYADRNTVGDWLSPNEKSRTFKMFKALVEQGAHVYGNAKAAPAPTQQFAFGGAVGGAESTGQPAAIPQPGTAVPQPSTAVPPTATPGAPTVGAAPAWLTSNQ